MQQAESSPVLLWNMQLLPQVVPALAAIFTYNRKRQLALPILLQTHCSPGVAPGGGSQAL